MLKKPGLEELVRELERDYARWEQVYMAGSKDPFWPDGVNADLCRNHILCGKRRIRELYPDAEMPEIYYRPLPQELPAEYMARKEDVPFPVSWTVKMKKKQKETQDILSYHTQAAGCSDKARAKASGGRQPIEECGRTGL